MRKSKQKSQFNVKSILDYLPPGSLSLFVEVTAADEVDDDDVLDDEYDDVPKLFV